jgi:hypothetical protein
MRADQQHFVVTFVAAPGTDDPVRALKALLKRSLRTFGLRCVDAREQAAPDGPAVQIINEFRGLMSPSDSRGA